tara:strand:+ start:8986 stop:12093 length:3108 start_codon:yes stop_codon:yes gene_type:complete
MSVNYTIELISTTAQTNQTWGSLDIDQDGYSDGGLVPIKMIIKPANIAEYVVSASSFTIAGELYTQVQESDPQNGFTWFSINLEPGALPSGITRVEMWNTGVANSVGNTVEVRAYIDPAFTTWAASNLVFLQLDIDGDASPLDTVNGIPSYVSFTVDQYQVNEGSTVTFTLSRQGFGNDPSYSVVPMLKTGSISLDNVNNSQYPGDITSIIGLPPVEMYPVVTTPDPAPDAQETNLVVQGNTIQWSITFAEDFVTEGTETLTYTLQPFDNMGVSTGSLSVSVIVYDSSIVPPVTGCTNPIAINYNSEAVLDDGSCILPLAGCTDEAALNYNENANVNDGSCIYPVTGCTDPTAINYNPSANVDDGSCIGVVEGCTNINAVNYNPEANVDDGSCQFTTEGCTDSTACNWNPLATEDDGSCVYAENRTFSLHYVKEVFGYDTSGNQYPAGNLNINAPESVWTTPLTESGLSFPYYEETYPAPADGDFGRPYAHPTNYITSSINSNTPCSDFMTMNNGNENQSQHSNISGYWDGVPGKIEITLHGCSLLGFSGEFSNEAGALTLSELGYNQLYNDECIPTTYSGFAQNVASTGINKLFGCKENNELYEGSRYINQFWINPSEGRSVSRHNFWIEADHCSSLYSLDMRIMEATHNYSGQAEVNQVTVAGASINWWNNKSSNRCTRYYNPVVYESSDLSKKLTGFFKYIEICDTLPFPLNDNSFYPWHGGDSYGVTGLGDLSMETERLMLTDDEYGQCTWFSGNESDFFNNDNPLGYLPSCFSIQGANSNAVEWRLVQQVYGTFAGKDGWFQDVINPWGSPTNQVSGQSEWHDGNGQLANGYCTNCDELEWKQTLSDGDKPFVEWGSSVDPLAAGNYVQDTFDDDGLPIYNWAPSLTTFSFPDIHYGAVDSDGQRIPSLTKIWRRPYSGTESGKMLFQGNFHEGSFNGQPTRVPLSYTNGLLNLNAQDFIGNSIVVRAFAADTDYWTSGSDSSYIPLPTNDDGSPVLNRRYFVKINGDSMPLSQGMPTSPTSEISVDLQF